MALPSPSRHGREAVGLRSQGVPGIVGTRGSGHGKTSEAVTASSQSQQGRTLGRQEACLPGSKTSLLIPVETPIISCISFFFFPGSCFLIFLHRCIGFRRTTARISHNYTWVRIPPLSGTSLPCPHPAIWVITEGQTELARPRFPSAVCPAHSTVYMLMTRSPFVPLFPSS